MFYIILYIKKKVKKFNFGFLFRKKCLIQSKKEGMYPVIILEGIFVVYKNR